MYTGEQICTMCFQDRFIDVIGIVLLGSSETEIAIAKQEE